MPRTLSLSWLDYPPDDLTGGAVCIGNFDGVHPGHRALIQQARSLRQPTVSMTFDPPPARILGGEPLPPPLTTLTDRVQLLTDAGADAIVFLQTTPELLALNPEAFFEEILQRRFRASVIVEGFNFRFGRAREGTNDILHRLAAEAGIGFQVVPPVMDNAEPISSSRIRAALLSGNVLAANRFLDRRYHLQGRVVVGQQRGRTLGIPTANLAEVETLLPAEGVYIVIAQLPDGQRFGAAANIGPNPTFGEDTRKIEVHLLDFSGDLYGERLRVEFVQRLRATQPFTGVPALIAQLQRDLQATRDYFTEYAP